MENKQTSAFLSIMIIISSILVFGYISHYKELTINAEYYEKLVLKNSELLIVLTASIFFNFYYVSTLLERILGYKKQGSRLRSLQNKKQMVVTNLVMLLFSTTTSSVLTLININLIKRSLSDFLEILGAEYFIITTNLVVASLVMSGSILIYNVSTLILSIHRRYKSSLPLGSQSEERNMLTMGTIGEEKEYQSKNKSPQWISISQKALNGNILITGSIGTGKTQGTVLNYTEQLFKKFFPVPSALVLDPKGSFIPEVEKILKNESQLERCIYLDEAHSNTFNPVYVENILKSSNYIEIAHMIRSAAKNISGDSKEAPIWEDNAFNLTKNIIVYCAATKGYFTLIDCYNAILIADSTEIIEGLELAIDSNNFDEEESFNILSAKKYFLEFQNYEEKFKSGVTVSSTTFLNQFQNYNSAKLFCPEKKGLTITSMDKVIDDGHVLLFNVENETLARSMGTFIKLHYQKSVLNRLRNTSRSKDRLAVIIADEYQDLVSVGSGGSIGDNKVCAKGREANFMLLASSQSINSIFNAIRNEKAAKELIQNFRTRIACHSTDIDTIRNFKELFGQDEIEKQSHSLSESSQKTSRNFLFGGFDSKNANINESVSTSTQKEHLVTGKEFSRLKSFEAFAQIYNGIETNFYKLYLKPYFLKDKNTKHSDILRILEGKRPKLAFKLFVSNLVKRSSVLATLTLAISSTAFAFPNVCNVVNAKEFNSCLNFRYTLTTCGSYPFVRPCYRFTYFVPQTFIEVSPKIKNSYFSTLPIAAAQLASSSTTAPFGAEHDDDTQSYHARTIAVPFAQMPFSTLPCDGTRMPKLCFDGMSEHIPTQWSTGMADKFQPNFLAWSLAPKACLIKGALASAMGGSTATPSSDSAMCSVGIDSLSAYPPSSHSACNGWGVFYPRMGSYNGPASLTGALMIASRMKSISSEIFKSMPTSFGEKWQMISPNTSSCFQEGQNIGLLETIKNAREMGRITNGKITGHLFVVWKPVSCKRDIPYLATSQAALAAIKPVCAGLGK